LGYSKAFHLGGDQHEKAYARAGDNLSALVGEERGGRGVPSDVVRWDATKIPLRDNSVDVVVSDFVRNSFS